MTAPAAAATAQAQAAAAAAAVAAAVDAGDRLALTLAAVSAALAYDAAFPRADRVAAAAAIAAVAAGGKAGKRAVAAIKSGGGFAKAAAAAAGHDDIAADDDEGEVDLANFLGDDTTSVSDSGAKKKVAAGEIAADGTPLPPLLEPPARARSVLPDGAFLTPLSGLAKTLACVAPETAATSSGGTPAQSPTQAATAALATVPAQWRALLPSGATLPAAAVALAADPRLSAPAHARAAVVDGGLGRARRRSARSGRGGDCGRDRDACTGVD